MAGYTLSALEADIRSYTEVDSTVFSGATSRQIYRKR